MIIGLDVGGTHTDVVLLDRKGLVKQIKVLTDKKDLFGTVLSGLDTIMDGIEAEKISRVVLSTTLTTNAIVQNKVKPVGIIVTSGPGIQPEMHRTNDDYYIVSGSIDHRGREIQPVDIKEIKVVIDKFQSKGIQHVGVIGKFSTRNPVHEIAIGKLLEENFDKVFLGHRVSGNLNFPRRIATTYLNASVYPIHREFFNAVNNSLVSKGLTIPIHILKADGGTMSFESSINFPGQTILSGPAASVMGAIPAAPASEDVAVLDIGGTTTDIALLINGVPILEPLGIELGKFKTLIRSLKTSSIGIGGDSAVRVDGDNIQIGPDRIGPAMAYGGTNVTPTDAFFVLEEISGGDKEKSIRGIEKVAEKLNVSIEEAAQKIITKTCEQILKEVRLMVDQVNSKPVYTVHDVFDEYKLNPVKIYILGGPAEYFTKYFKKISDFTVNVVPECKVANAIGAALARTTCEVTLFADTEQGVVTSSESEAGGTCGKKYSRSDAVEQASEILRKKAISTGSSEDDFEIEVIEDLEFNMVRGFYTSGKNIRVKVQVKPGIISGYEYVWKARGADDATQKE